VSLSRGGYEGVTLSKKTTWPFHLESKPPQTKKTFARFVIF
jgi:hypothetical protein